MRTVLFVAYHFPPLGGAGVQRSLKFVRYLGGYGYRPAVLSVKPECVRRAKDRTMLAEVPPEIRVERAPTLDPDYLYKLLYGLKAFRLVEWLNRRVFVPDIQTVWTRFASARLDRLVREEKPALIYVSGAPFSAFGMGVEAARRHNLPLILDFRDEWTTNPVEHRAIALSDRERRLERRALEHAAGVVCLSPLMRKHLAAVHPVMERLQVETIPNGYDEQDFTGLEPVTGDGSVMRIVFTGTLYGRFIETFRRVVAGMELAVSRGDIAPDRIRIEVYGRNTPRTVLPESSPRVAFHGYLNHPGSIRRLLGADLLLLPVGCDPGLASHYSGKLFEYLRSGRPILGIVPESGEAADVLRSTRTGIVSPDETPETLARMLTDHFHSWRTGTLSVDPDLDQVRNYERRVLTGRLAGLFDRVLETGR